MCVPGIQQQKQVIHAGHLKEKRAPYPIKK